VEGGPVRALWQKLNDFWWGAPTPEEIDAAHDAARYEEWLLYDEEGKHALRSRWAFVLLVFGAIVLIFALLAVALPYYFAERDGRHFRPLGDQRAPATYALGRHAASNAWSEVAYMQVGDNPGRKEPTTGEMNYRNIFRHLQEKGYAGVVGMEHGNSKPGVEGEKAVIEAYRASDTW